MKDYRAILLLGPTGSGKTPLGDLCQRNGLWGKRCAHFDFGANLRKVAENHIGPSSLTHYEMKVVIDSLRTGALLEDDNFLIAQKLMTEFAERISLAEDDLIVLNGMPRHVGQADDIDTFVKMEMVLHLKCTPGIVYERISRDTGGDRSGRIDDSYNEIRKKLKLFDERTLPLLDHYCSKRVRTEVMEVNADTTEESLYHRLELLP